MLLNCVDFNHLGVLSLVGMVGAIVHVEVLDELTTEAVLGKHTLDYVEVEGMHTRLEVLVERLLHQSLGSILTLTAGVTGVVIINTISHLFAGEDNLVGVDDDNVVAASYVRRVAGLVLSAENFRNFRAKAAEYLVGSIDDHPLLLYALGVGG